MLLGIRWGSLRAKIIAWSFVPTAIILVVVALVTFSAYQQVTEELAIERDQELTRLSAGQLAASLAKYSDLLAAEAHLVAMHAGNPDAQRDALQQAANRLSVFDGGALILDTFGTVVAAEPQRPDILGQDWSDRSYYREILLSSTPGTTRPVFSNAVADGPQGADIVAVAVPIIGERGELLGSLVGMFRLGATGVSAFYGDIVKLRIGGSGNAYLVDGEGQVIYHPDTDRIGEDFSAQAVVQRVTSGETGASRTRDFEGQDIVAGYAPVPGAPWGLVTQENWDALIGASQGYRQFLLILLVLGVVVPALVVAVGTQRITRSIVDLIGAAQSVASGRFGQTITARTGDEIEELAQQFNRMSAQLQASYAHLEQRVADRTKDLATLNSITAVVSRSLDLEDTLCNALQEALETLDFESGAIYLRDARSGELQIGCHQGLSEEFRTAVSKGIVSARVAESGNAVIIDDLLAVTGAPREIVAEGYRSLASIPLVAKGQVEGVLTVARRQVHRFGHQDVDLLLSIGNQMGVAIENARLFRAEQRRAEQFKLMSEVGRRVTSMLDIDELLEQLVTLIQQSFDYYLVDIGLVKGESIIFKAGAGRPYDSGFKTFRLKLNQESITGWVATCGEPLLVPDVHQEHRYVNAVAADSWSELAVPLKAMGKVIGVLNVESDRRDAFDNSDLAVLQALADQAVIAIENARLFNAEQRRAEQFRVISEVGRRITSTLDVDELLKQLADLICQGFDYYLVEIGLIEKDEIVFKAGAGATWDGGFESFRLKVDGESVSGWVAATGQSLRVPDVRREPRYVKVGSTHTRSELCVPLKTKEQVVGVLNVESDHLGAFDESDQTVLQALADQAVIAIEKARLFEAEQRRAEQFRVISEVGRRITSILDVDELMEQMVGLIQKAFNYYHVGMGLIDGNEVVYKVGAGPLWDDPDYQFKPGRLTVGREGITGWVAATGEPLLVPDVSVEPRYVLMQGSTTRSELTVAVKAAGQVIGVLDVQSDRLNAFDASDVTVLQSLADQAGIGIQNARLFRDAQHRAEQFRVISDIGHHITSILPIDELLSRMVRLIQEAFSYYAVGIGLVEGDEVVFKAGAGGFWDDYSELYRSLRLKVGQEGFTGWVAKTGEPLLVPDVSQDARYYYVPEASRTQAEMTVPLKIKGAVIGVLGVQSDRLSAFDEGDLVVLQSLAHHAAIAIENARLYERAKELAVLEERQRLARELHDAVTQTLFSASLIAEALPRLWERNPDEGRRRLEDLRQWTRGALAEMRTLLLELRPASLAEADLGDLLRQLAESITGRARLPITVMVEGQGPLPPDVKVALYRIAQEALNNVAKHANASQATISLQYAAVATHDEEPREGVELHISDDGRGFDPDGVAPERLGLGIMAERAKSMGANLKIDSEIGRGTEVTVVWPDSCP